MYSHTIKVVWAEYNINKHSAELQIRKENRDDSEIIFLFLDKNICCDPSLEPSLQDGSNDSSQHMFLWCNMEKYP